MRLLQSRRCLRNALELALKDSPDPTSTGHYSSWGPSYPQSNSGFAHSSKNDSLWQVVRNRQHRPHSTLPTPSSLHSYKLEPPSLPPRRQGVWKPVAFCVATSAATFATAAIVEERSYRRTWDHYLTRGKLFATETRSEWGSSLPPVLQNLYREFWVDASPARRAVGVVTAVNVAVFAAWHGLPGLRGAMIRNFVHALPPLPFHARTLLTSNFTHQTLTHLAVNTLAFWSFGIEAAKILGVHQFAAFYISAGLASGLLSHLGRLRSRLGGFSVGASGAIYACFALTAITRPDQEVVLIFLPWLPVQIGDALAIAVSFDCLGILLGWRQLDHFGHLGGALFGIYYVLRGQNQVWPRFQRLAESLTDTR